jgi:hypothetical protein
VRDGRSWWGVAGTERQMGTGRRKMSEMRAKWGEKETTCVFAIVQKFNFFFFFWADVEDATSARDGC